MPGGYGSEPANVIPAEAERQAKHVIAGLDPAIQKPRSGVLFATNTLC